MASQDWQEIYRSNTSEELVAEKARLSQVIRDREGITSQSFGNKTWANDLGELRNKLHAVVRVLNERAMPSKTAPTGIVDYSNVRVS